MTDDIASWLARLGLAKYVEVFARNEIDVEALRYLGEDDLKELGLPIGPRRKVLAAARLADDGGQTAGLAQRRPRSEAERRQLTVMFVDLVGSTALSQQLDPEEMRDLMAAYHDAVSSEVGRFDGHVAKLMGDGVLAYFGWPRAHEDDAGRAVRAGLAAIMRVSGLSTPNQAPLAARVGIATGLVVVGDLIGEGPAQEEAVVGEAPNLAARLQSLAEPNTVVVSSSTQKLIVGSFETSDLGAADLKGFAKPVRAWRIEGDAEVERRTDVLHAASRILVGRDDEIGLLLDRWRRACAGDGQVILLSGEPGIGKSRLIGAFVERLDGEPCKVLRYFCSAYHANSAFYPAIRQVERAAGMHRDDSIETKLDKLERLLSQTGFRLAETVPLLAHLMSIDATGRYARLNLTTQAEKFRTGVLLADLVTSNAAARPVVMVVEDAHWIDPSTSNWLDGVVDRLRQFPLLLIISFRSDFQPPWAQLPCVTDLPLGRLERDEGEAIIAETAGGKPLPAEATEQILAKTEGVPLFVEELTKTVIESGVLTDAGDRYVLSGPLPALAVPSTLQDSLMARLDRLGWPKEVAQAGACIGRTFHHRLLAAILDHAEPLLEKALEQLQDAGLLFRDGVPPEASYTFKHALVQDTAYQSLLKSRRQTLHAAIAAALEQVFPEIVAAEPEVLAHHYGVAGLVDMAIAYWLRAGQAALKRSADHEAIAHLSKGIELTTALPKSEERQRRELDLQATLGVCLKATRGFGAPEVLQAYSRVHELSEKFGDKARMFIALAGEASHYTFAGKLRAAAERGRQCLELAQSADDENLLMEAHHRLWATTFHLGQYDLSEQHLSQGLACYDPERHHWLTYAYSGHDPGVCCRTHSARVLWQRGYPDQGLHRAYEALQLAERVAHPFSTLLAEATLCEVLLLRGDADKARGRFTIWGATARDLLLPVLAADSRVHAGWALALEGHYEAAILELREGIAESRAAGSNEALFPCLLAWACCEAGLTSDGLSALDDAFAHSGDEQHHRPEFFRLKGELLSRLGSHDPSPGDCFSRALELAVAQGAKSLELRAATSLAGLYHAQGRDDWARDVLLPVYDWFGEGRDTRDHLRAKALLDQLR